MPFGGAESDALHYHLVLLRVYLEQHSLATLSWSIPDKYPLLLHMASLAGFAVAGPLFPKTLVLFAYFGTQALLFILASRFASRSWALWAVAVFSGVLAIVIQAGTAMIDLPTLFLMLAPLEGLLRFQRDGDRLAFWAGALAAGIVAASRVFTVANAVLLAGLFFLSRSRARGVAAAFRETFLFLALVSVVYLPWVFRAWHKTGNPVFPLGSQWLGEQGWIPLPSRDFKALRPPMGWEKASYQR